MHWVYCILKQGRRKLFKPGGRQVVICWELSAPLMIEIGLSGMPTSGGKVWPPRPLWLQQPFKEFWPKRAGEYGILGSAAVNVTICIWYVSHTYTLRASEMNEPLHNVHVDNLFEGAYFAYFFSKINYFLFTTHKVHLFWEGCKVLQNLHLTFVLCSASQK